MELWPHFSRFPPPKRHIPALSQPSPSPLHLNSQLLSIVNNCRNGVSPAATLRHHRNTATSSTKVVANSHHPRLPQYATQATPALVQTKPKNTFDIGITECIKVQAGIPPELPASCIQPRGARRLATAPALRRWNLRCNTPGNQLYLQPRDTGGWRHAAI